MIPAPDTTSVLWGYKMIRGVKAYLFFPFPKKIISSSEKSLL